MLKKYAALLVAMGVILAMAGCAQPTATDAPESGTAPYTAPETPEVPPAATAPTAESVWTQTLESGAYKSWQRAPGYETQQPAKGPHGKKVDVYVNDAVTKALATPGTAAWPAGSMIVKDAFDAAGKLVSMEYMEKTDQGWYYATFDTTGKSAKQGVQVAPCQPCHTKGSDSVMAFKLP